MPAGGRTNLPGQQVPNPTVSGLPQPTTQTDPGMMGRGEGQEHEHMDVGEPGTPQRPGTDRNGPSPNMEYKAPPADGAPMLADPSLNTPPMDPATMGGPEMGAQGNMLEALQQWLSTQMNPQAAGPAPAAGSSSMQNDKDVPKPVGMDAPPTHAGFHQRKVEETAQKSLFDDLFND